MVEKQYAVCMSCGVCELRCVYCSVWKLQCVAVVVRGFCGEWELQCGGAAV